jgi:hypothetical protein
MQALIRNTQSLNNQMDYLVKAIEGGLYSYRGVPGATQIHDGTGARKLDKCDVAPVFDPRFLNSATSAKTGQA